MSRLVRGARTLPVCGPLHFSARFFGLGLPTLIFDFGSGGVLSIFRNRESNFRLLTVRLSIKP